VFETLAKGPALMSLNARPAHARLSDSLEYAFPANRPGTVFAGPDFPVRVESPAMTILHNLRSAKRLET
jgi:hypothetical protein